MEVFHYVLEKLLVYPLFQKWKQKYQRTYWLYIILIAIFRQIYKKKGT